MLMIYQLAWTHDNSMFTLIEREAIDNRIKKATQELNVKFKADTSDLKTKSDEAKQKVKNAASEMASDVKNASSSMEQHLDKVAQSAKGIGSAAKTVGASVKTLENQVAQSSNKMAGDLGKVADQVKNISARQVVGIASRGLNIAGGFVSKIGSTYEEGSSERMTADIGAGALNGAASGAMMGAGIGSIIPGLGTAAGAAIGAAAGALAGAANALWDASEALKKSAEEQQQAAEQAFRTAGREKYERTRLGSYQEESNQWLQRLQQQPLFESDKYRNIDAVYAEQKQRQRLATEAQNRYDEFVSQHQYDSGQQALNNAPMLEALRRGVQVTQERLQAFSQVVAAAEQMENELIRSEEEEIEARERAAEAARRETQAREQAAESVLQKRSSMLAVQDRLAGYAQESNAWRNKKPTEIAEENQRRREAMQSAVNERDSYLRANQNAKGADAVKVAEHLAELDAKVTQTTEQFQSFQPVLNDTIAEGNERKKQAESALAYTQRQLEGLASKPMGSNPNDALTKMGGGVGYASYNNSTASVQMRIENHLRKLADTQKAQLQEIINRLETLNNESASEWSA